MVAMESGTFQSSSEPPVQDATAPGAPTAAAASGTIQPTTASQPQTALDEMETPCLDSLPSTPRANDRDSEEETPNPFEAVSTDNNSLSQELVADALTPPEGATAQPTSGSAPMELDMAIGVEQRTLGPVSMPATTAQPAAAAGEQHVSGSAHQPGDGGTNQRGGDSH